MVESGRRAALPWQAVVALAAVIFVVVTSGAAEAAPRRILVDTDMETDDLLALTYLMKQNRSEFELKAVTITANAWSNAGHAVNHLYDMLYMMGRDDVLVGVGGDGGISYSGTIYPNVGGFLSMIDQGMTTAGDCRYRQAIPRESGGRLDIDTNMGIRSGFLPQGYRRYIPLKQPTVQQVLIDTISEGPTTVILLGSHTNFAIFLMSYPQLRKNVEHIYIMGGGVRSKNPAGCCPENATTSCTPTECGDHGNLFTSYATNPNAEFNIFADPFAAYQVFHSGIPITLVPLDATNTIPITEEFFDTFQNYQSTYEAQYCFKSLKMARDTWSDDEFNKTYCMWDSFTSGIAISGMRNDMNHELGNDFVEFEYMNITVITSNKPYGVSDGSNLMFDGRKIPRFGLEKDGVHSGHVQTGITDSFCRVKGSNKGRCEDGYTKEVSGLDAVRIRVATKARPNTDKSSPLDREFYKSFLEALNRRENSGRFNMKTQFPFYREVLYKPDFVNKNMGKSVVFDMDMSPGDIVALIYLLKAPIELINLKGILVSGNGWANIASIDIIYNILHMMGRDDIPVGRGNTTALGTPNLGCKYVSVIPQGSGGLLDSDTLYGLARSLPRSPRRYTAENSVKYGAPRDTDHPELRQPLAFEVWQSIIEKLDPSEKITVLTNGPLTNLANIVLADKNASSAIERVYVVGGHIGDKNGSMGNLFTVPSTKYAEFNMYLDPLAAKTVLESTLDITFIPLSSQKKAASFQAIIKAVKHSDRTPELKFVHRLLLLLHDLQQKHKLYHHMDIFLGEVLGAVYLVEGSTMNPSVQLKSISIVDKQNANPVKVLVDFSSEIYYTRVAKALGRKEQSAVIGSIADQRATWSKPPKNSNP